MVLDSIQPPSWHLQEAQSSCMVGTPPINGAFRLTQCICTRSAAKAEAARARLRTPLKDWLRIGMDCAGMRAKQRQPQSLSDQPPAARLYMQSAQTWDLWPRFTPWPASSRRVTLASTA